MGRLCCPPSSRGDFKEAFPHRSIHDGSKGLGIHSNFEDIGSAAMSDSDMRQWRKEAGFCYNDLIPRNILPQSSEGHKGGGNTK